MQGPQKVFISHAHEDNARCRPLLDLFDRWGVAYWFTVESIRPGSELSDEIQRALHECDVFLRVCTTAAQRSYWMRLESGAYRGLRGVEGRDGASRPRTMISLVLDAAYAPEPFELATTIEAVGMRQAKWRAQLRAALGLSPEPVDRRRVAALSVATALLVLAVALGGAALVAAAGRAEDEARRQGAQPTATATATLDLPTATPTPGPWRTDDPPVSLRWTRGYQLDASVAAGEFRVCLILDCQRTFLDVLHLPHSYDTDSLESLLTPSNVERFSQADPSVWAITVNQASPVTAANLPNLPPGALQTYYRYGYSLNGGADDTGFTVVAVRTGQGTYLVIARQRFLAGGNVLSVLSALAWH
jgi:TIR domain